MIIHKIALFINTILAVMWFCAGNFIFQYYGSIKNAVSEYLLSLIFVFFAYINYKTIKKE